MLNKTIRVYAYDLEVGSMPVEDYEQLAKAVRNDFSLILPQLLVIAKVIFRMLGKIVSYVPLICFWLAFFVCLYDYAELARYVASSSFAWYEVAQAFVKVVQFVSLALVLCCGVDFALRPRSYDFENLYETETKKRIQKLFKLSVDANALLVVEESVLNQLADQN